MTLAGLPGRRDRRRARRAPADARRAPTQELATAASRSRWWRRPRTTSRRAWCRRRTPSRATEAQPGSTVRITVSTGPEQAPVPDVVEQDEDSARAILEDAGFERRRPGGGGPGSRPGRHRRRSDPGAGRRGRPRLGRSRSWSAQPAARRGRRGPVGRPTDRLRVAVLMGGRSSEREVSLTSARSVVEGLDPKRYDVREVEIGPDGRWELPPRRAGRLELGSAGDSPPDPGRGHGWSRSATSTSSSPSSTGRSARTEPSRASSSSPESPTSAQASAPRRSAWTRTSSSRSCATRASRWRPA